MVATLTVGTHGDAAGLRLVSAHCFPFADSDCAQVFATVR